MYNKEISTILQSKSQWAHWNTMHNLKIYFWYQKLIKLL